MAAISQLPTDHSPLVPAFNAITVDRVEEIAQDDDPQLGADIDRVLR